MFDACVNGASILEIYMKHSHNALYEKLASGMF